MIDYVQGMIDSFLLILDQTIKLQYQQVKIYLKWMKTVQKLKTIKQKNLYFYCKRFIWAQPNIYQTIAFFCIQVKDPNQNDWDKLIWLLKHLNTIKNNKLILSINDIHIIKWYAYIVLLYTLIFEVILEEWWHMVKVYYNLYLEKKLNMQNNIKGELVRADNMSIMIL